MATGGRWPHDLFMSSACPLASVALAGKQVKYRHAYAGGAQPHTTLTTTGRSNRKNIFLASMSTSPLLNDYATVKQCTRFVTMGTPAAACILWR
jgi:hypothetical protein